MVDMFCGLRYMRGSMGECLQSLYTIENELGWIEISKHTLESATLQSLGPTTF